MHEKFWRPSFLRSELYRLYMLVSLSFSALVASCTKLAPLAGYLIFNDVPSNK